MAKKERILEPEKESKREKDLEAIKKVKEQEAFITKQALAIKYESFSSSAYTEMDNYVRMVARGHSTGLLIEGPAGVGKTTRTLQIVNKEMSVTDVAYVDSFTTPAAFYTWLYENRDKKVLIIDDVAGLMNNGKCLAMLKGALWEVNGKERIVSYLTTKPLKDSMGEDVPGRCELKAGIIVLTNYLDKRSPHVQAVLSRISSCRLKVSKKELLEVMEQIVQKPFKNLQIEERREVFEYLKSQAEDRGASFNLRTLIKAFQFKAFSNDIKDELLWKNLVLKSFDKQDNMLIVEAIFKDGSLLVEKDREKKFSEITGLERRMWYRYKEKYIAEYGKPEKKTEEQKP